MSVFWIKKKLLRITWMFSMSWAESQSCKWPRKQYRLRKCNRVLSCLFDLPVTRWFSKHSLSPLPPLSPRFLFVPISFSTKLKTKVGSFLLVLFDVCSPFCDPGKSGHEDLFIASDFVVRGGIYGNCWGIVERQQSWVRVAIHQRESYFHRIQMIF